MKQLSLRYAVCAAVAACALGASVAAAQDAVAVAAPVEAPLPEIAAVQQHWGMLEQYCFECHNFEDWAGGVAFDTMSADSVPQEAEIWEEAVRKLRGRLMPPPGEPRPSSEEIDGFVAAMEGALDAAAARHPDPGRVALHRLNRTEYELVIKDLLDLDVDAAALLPQDPESEGFHNIASVLSVSPSFLDQYVAAARDVAVLAVGPSAPKPGRAVYRADGEDQTIHVAGLPLGTRGGLLARHNFTADGVYEFDITGLATAGYVSGLDDAHTLIMTIDGRKVFEASLGGEEDLRAVDQELEPALAAIQDRFQNIRIPVPAGPHDVGVAFIARSLARSDAPLEPLGGGEGESRTPKVGQLGITGPFDPNGVGETPSRAKIFSCHPETAAEERPCAEEILTTLARRAYRRPVTADDLADPMRFYETGYAAGGFEEGARSGLTAILASPHFLFRAIRTPEGVAPGEAHRISDIELASRLSFFLWSRGPDDQLLEEAEQGRLSDPGVLEAEVRRMLADPRAHSLVTSFAFQWLRVNKVGEVDPDPALFPEYDRALLSAFRTEIEMFVSSVFEEDRPVTDLLTADYTFVNERLARHYGIGDVQGDQFRRVTLEDSARWGLLGKGIFLMGTSYGNRTAPVLRGAFILENIIGTPPSPPPPNVEALEAAKVAPGQVRTVRELMVAHRTNPSCNACHGVMDPLGLSLENFDAIGAWRVKDRNANATIDASGELADGRPVNGPDDLRSAIMSRPDQFVQTLTQKLMTYALGRQVEAHDMPTVRAIVREAGEHDYRFSELVLGIVRSDAFLMSIAPDVAPHDEASLDPSLGGAPPASP